MKKILAVVTPLIAVALLSLSPLSAMAWRGSYQLVTLTSNDITSTVSEIDGSELARTECIISNPDASYNVYVAPGSNTYSARYYYTIPPGEQFTLPAHNMNGTYLTNNKFYAYVSPTPYTITIGFISVKAANPDPTE